MAVRFVDTGVYAVCTPNDTQTVGNTILVVLVAKINAFIVLFLYGNSSREEGMGGYTNQMVAHPHRPGSRLHRLPPV